jgi:transposase
MESLVWLGVDIGKDSFHAAVAVQRLFGQEWRKLPCASFEHSAVGLRALLNWLKTNSIAPESLDGVCVESTGRLAQQFVKLFKGRMGAVSIINPARSKSFIESLGFKHKNDSVDARLLAYFGQQLRPRAQVPRDECYEELRELSRAYEDLQGQCQADKQRLADGPTSRTVCTLLKRMIRTYTREMEALQIKIKALIEATSALKEDTARIVSVPGLGMRTAQMLLAEFTDLRKYNRDELIALAGLYPRQYESGTSVYKAPRIAKAGKSNVRAVLYMAAMSALRCNPKIKDFGQRLKDNGKRPMQIIVAAMRKLLLIAHALLASNTFYDPQHNNLANAQKNA